MYELPLEKAERKTTNGHQYYVFPAPPHHTNQVDRPTVYAKVLETYMGKGSKGTVKLHPGVMEPANVLMSALIEYGTKINDWSMRSAYIHNGYRPDDATQGYHYLRIIKSTIAGNPKIFETLTFPSNLEADAQSVLGIRGDPRREAFRKKVAESPGWTQKLAYQLFGIVDDIYAPRGFNPHSTGFVFDLDFSIISIIKGKIYETMLGTSTALNGWALQSAAGLWLNTYAMNFGFDSYNTGREVFHLEYRYWMMMRSTPGQSHYRGAYAQEP
jgi:hypothetical protein